MKNRLVRLYQQEVTISKAKSLVQYFGRRKENAYFLGDYRQMLQKVPLHCQ
jgi:hypothetical protein